MRSMSKFDHSDLDGRLLQLLVAVVETGSVTARGAAPGRHAVGREPPAGQAARHHRRPAVRQVRARHRATARAEALAAQARVLLGAWSALPRSGASTRRAGRPPSPSPPTTSSATCCCPPCCAAALQAGAGRAAVIPSDVPSLEMLRSEHCQLVISPRPPDGADILQKRLFEDRYRVFYDPAVRLPPLTRADYLAAAHHRGLRAAPQRWTWTGILAAQGMQRRFVVMVPGFAGLPPFCAAARCWPPCRRLQSHPAARPGQRGAARALPAHADVHGLACTVPIHRFLARSENHAPHGAERQWQRGQKPHRATRPTPGWPCPVAATTPGTSHGARGAQSPSDRGGFATAPPQCGASHRPVLPLRRRGRNWARHWRVSLPPG
jgi:hypothetical protein